MGLLLHDAYVYKFYDLGNIVMNVTTYNKITRIQVRWQCTNIVVTDIVVTIATLSQWVAVTSPIFDRQL